MGIWDKLNEILGRIDDATGPEDLGERVREQLTDFEISSTVNDSRYGEVSRIVADADLRDVAGHPIPVDMAQDTRLASVLADIREIQGSGDHTAGRLAAEELRAIINDYADDMDYEFDWSWFDEWYEDN